MIFMEFCISLPRLASTKALLDKLFGCYSLIFLNFGVGLTLFGQYKTLTAKILKNLKN